MSTIKRFITGPLLPFLKQTLLYFIPLAFIVSVVSYSVYVADTNREEAELKEKHHHNIAVVTGSIYRSLSILKNDLLYLAASNPLQQTLESHTDENIAHLNNTFALFSETKLDYDQIRWLDEKGLEQVRINLVDNKAVVVDDTLLQSKQDRYFFEETMKLKQGEIYISPMDLNVEFGQITKPYKPTVRISTPVFNSVGERKGIVILNFLAQHLIDHFIVAAGEISSEIMMVDKHGYWLMHPDKTLEWGMMFDNGASIVKHYPQSWQQMYEKNASQFIDAEGIWTHQKIFPFLDNEDYFWDAISFVSADKLQQVKSDLIQKRVVATSVIWIVILLIAMIAARLRLLHQVAMREAVDAEYRFRMMADHSAAFVWRTDIAGQPIYMNKTWLELTGLDEGQVLSRKTWLRMVHPEDIRRAMQPFYDDTKHDSHECQYRIKDKNGLWHWLQQVATPLFDDNNKFVGYTGSAIDISSLNDTLRELRLVSAAFNGQEGVMITDLNKTIIRVNESFTELTGYSRDEAVGQKPSLLRSGKHASEFYVRMWEDINSQFFWQGEIYNRRKDGELYLEWLTITAVKDDNDVVTHYVGCFSDVTKYRAAEEEIQKLEFHDVLTGLPNKRMLFERMDHAILSSVRHREYGAVLLIDIDNFKRINDTQGHNVGDQALIELSQRITHCIRDLDTVSRQGGDEFSVLLEELGQEYDVAVSSAEAIAGKISEAIKQPIQLGDYRYPSSASIGMVMFISDENNSAELFKRADAAMYQAKRSGKNTIRFYEPKMQELLSQRLELEHDLHDAIPEQLEVYYQAQVTDLLDVTGAELLIRWHHPKHGMVSPLKFIDLAEENGLIILMGEWVIEEACKRINLWKTDPVKSQWVLAVNVSARQFRQENFVTIVLQLIADNDVDPTRLKLELTESIAVENIEETVAKMNALREQGITFSLDDFGTGQSSLTYLKRLPFEQVKIDQSFIRDIMNDKSDAALVKTIIGMADNLDLAVIAEGVETEAQAAFLARNDCHAFQGYLFAKPMPVEEMEKKFASGKARH